MLEMFARCTRPAASTPQRLNSSNACPLRSPPRYERMRRKFCGGRLQGALAVCAGVVATLPAGLAGAEIPAQNAPAVPAEETRLNRAIFREALRKRGLTELLELHLRDFPPTGQADALLMKRDLRLAEFADPNCTDQERQAAIAEANWILQKLIEDYPYDLRRFEWRSALAHSLLYDQAEPLITSILYRGGSRTERSELGTITTRVVNLLTSLHEDLAAEYERVDKLPIRQFEQLERSGHIETIDRLGPQAEYLMLWALLYDSLPRDDTDLTRARRLNRIRTMLANDPATLDTPHDVSHVQVQSVVLAGITERMLNNHAAARQYFQRALLTAGRLADRGERERIQWAVTLAQVESVRNERDDGCFDEALNALSRFRQRIAGRGEDNFGLRIVGALLERSVHRARAAAAERDGQAADADRYREDAWAVLARLARRHPDRKDEIYATLYTVNDGDVDPGRLDPFDQCALIAGLLFDVGEADEEADPRLGRVIQVGELFLAKARGRALALVPEVVYNMAVAEYRRGHLVAAARRFLEVARDHSTWDNASSAATYAVQLAAELHADPELRNHPELRELYRNALDVLVTHYADTAAGRYWRFYYAQLLDEFGEYDSAAGQYALVHVDHEHYQESAFSRVRCLAMDLRRFLGGSPEDLLNLRQRAADFFAVQRDFLTEAGSALNRLSDSAQLATVKTQLARAKLIGAEVQVLPQINRPGQALENLAGFETAYPEQSGLIGRVWRVRLLAYERLGQLADAARAIPAYVTADPQSAGPTLHALSAAMAEDVKRLRREGDDRAAQRKAEVALLLAEQVVAWAERYDSDAAPADRRVLSVHLAEANLHAGRYQRARELFEQCGVPERTTLPKEPIDLRVMYGYAEAQFQLDEWLLALPWFNALALGLPPADPVRWESLLRDLQCRTALNHPPGDVIKVLEQQRYLYPELGGPYLAKEFEKLQRENQRRVDGE